MTTASSPDPGVHAVDFDVLRTATGGDRDLMQELAELYLGDADLKLRALGDAFSNDEMHRIRSIARDLRDASVSVGAHDAADAFGRLEDAAREGEAPVVEEAITEVQQHFVRVRRALADLR